MCSRQPLVVLGFQPPSERAAQTTRTLPKRERFGVVRVAELLLNAYDALAGDLLLCGCQIIRPRCGQDGLQALGEVLALLDAHADPRIQLSELRVDLRQQRLVVQPAQSDDIVEGIEAGLPGNEPRPQVLEVEVVVQCSLEVVRCHQLHQIVSFRCIGQVAQADNPGFVLPTLLADQLIEKLPLPDAADRCVDSLDLVAEELERATVADRGATVQFYAGVRMRYGERDFLNRGICWLTTHQDVPWDECAVILLGGGLGPACPQKSLVGERSLEMDAVQ